MSTDFARLAAAQSDAERQAKTMPPELFGVIGRAWLLLLSPIVLILAWLLVHSTSRDLIIQDNKAYLWAWALGVASLALSQMVWKSTLLVAVRKALLVAAIIATFGVAGGYVYLAATSWQGAVASRPERTFELLRRAGRRRTEIYHQRSDGTLLAGGYRAPVLYASTCVIAQRLDGANGFSWVRVLERSRERGRNELNWPIRREECFSDIPLSTLPR